MSKKANLHYALVLFVATLFFSGCSISSSDKNLEITDLNISRNSAFVEQENIKSATAILIKKSRMYDQGIHEARGLQSELESSKSAILALQNKVDDLLARINLLTEDMSRLVSATEQMKLKKQTDDINSTLSDSIKKDIKIDIDTVAVAVPKVVVKKIPLTDVPNKKEKKKLKKSKESKKKSRNSVKHENNNKLTQTECIEPIVEKTIIEKSDTVDKVSSVMPIVKKSTDESSQKSFSSLNGKALVNRNTYFYSSPVAKEKYKSVRVKEGELIEYSGKNNAWYKISEGKYLKATSAVDISIGQKK